MNLFWTTEDFSFTTNWSFEGSLKLHYIKKYRQYIDFPLGQWTLYFNDLLQHQLCTSNYLFFMKCIILIFFCQFHCFFSYVFFLYEFYYCLQSGVFSQNRFGFALLSLDGRWTSGFRGEELLINMFAGADGFNPFTRGTNSTAWFLLIKNDTIAGCSEAAAMNSMRQLRNC